MKFKLISKFKPSGDQPRAIEKLIAGVKAGRKHQVLLGVTGSGKTFTMANVIAKIQKPTLVISHNKTLAAQLYQEFKEFFPENEVHYFVSYYDYYQPEAYIPQIDTYIEKDAKINEEIDRLRHAATQTLLNRQDTIIVASVSCIYNIGSPQAYQDISIELKIGQSISRQQLLHKLISLQYERNDIEFKRGTFRIRGEVIEIWSATGNDIYKIELFNNQIDKITKTEMREYNIFKPVKNHEMQSIRLYPAKYWVSPENKVRLAIENIKQELEKRLKELKSQDKILESERLRRRTIYDLEMLKELGYCHGVENYSRHLEFRKPGEAPFSLLDYFKAASGDKDNFLIIIDESHMTIPQIRGMYEGDRSRKQTLVDYGFRLPSALDNRPLKFNEFEKRVNQVIYTSATPAFYEINKSKKENGGAIIEQLVRPTGLLDPRIKIRPTKNQIPDLINEINKCVTRRQKVLVTTLTKRLAEDLAEYLRDEGIKTHYLHSEIKTLERPEILRDLRLGKYDVIVGINLLREGLDIPEVSFVAILDADKEGFLRNETTLIQTMGRAARHQEGHIVMYADRMTKSMKIAMEETLRRRKVQKAYNKKHKITPCSIQKPIRETGLPAAKKPEKIIFGPEYMKEYLKELELKADLANRNLQFDKAIEIKEEIKKLKDELVKTENK